MEHLINWIANATIEEYILNVFVYPAFVIYALAMVFSAIRNVLRKKVARQGKHRKERKS